jgi:small subunit ribosomal protein S20
MKRTRQSEKRRIRNRSNRSRVKTAIKAVDQAIVELAGDTAQEALKAAIPLIDKAAGKGAFHKRNASRKISRLTKRVNAFVSGSQPAA